MTTAVLHQDDRTITLRMSLNRWKRLQKLEDSYKVANAINKASKQVDSAPVMNIDEAISFLRAL